MLARRLRGLLWNVPVGLQLSLIYATLVAATLALLGWALYAQLDGFLVRNTAERLEQATGPVLQRRVPLRAGDVTSFLVQELSRSDVVVAVLNRQGAIISITADPATGGPAYVPDLPDSWADQVANGTPAQWVIREPGRERQLVVLTPLTVRAGARPGETLLYLQQAASLGAADAVLNQLRLYVVLGIVFGTLIGTFAGLALTRVVLRPLDRMARTAEAIAAGDLSRRLRLPPGSNEVARLGGAFDHMVGRLGAALEAQRRFVADASHELRTPLTSIEGLSEMLLMGADRGDTAVVQRTVRTMHRELGRLGRLVADLLTLSRLDSTMPSTLKPLDASRLAAEVADQMRAVADTREVSLVVDASEPVIVYGEPDRLKQVLLNLVDNALRYTPPGGRVELSARVDAEVGTALVEVADTGDGIAPGDLPHIFDRFYRGDLSRARASGNTGLGLAIAQAIVQAHGGTIEAQSVLGVGTRFTIVLPGVQGVGLPMRAYLPSVTGASAIESRSPAELGSGSSRD